MTAKEYLSEVQTLQTMIEQKQETIKQIWESITTVHGLQYDREKVQGGKQTDRIEESVAKIVDLEKEAEADIVNLIHKKHEIITQIHALDNYRYIQLLFKRYIEFKKFQTVAEEMNLTDQYVKEMHPKALKAFEKQHQNILQKEGKQI